MTEIPFDMTEISLATRQENYVVTGSRKYGGSNNNSDLDIVMLDEDATKLYKLLEEVGFSLYSTCEIADDYKSFYIKIKGFPELNIVVVDTKEELAQWRYATDIFCNSDVPEDKEERVKKFRQLRNNYKPL